MGKINKKIVLLIMVLAIVLSSCAVFVACAKSCTITLDFDGGKLNGEKSQTLSVKVGQTVDLTAYTPTKTGYFVAGWTDGTNNYVGSFVAKGDVTLRPIWRSEDDKTTLSVIEKMIEALSADSSYSFEYAGQGTSEGKVTNFSIKALISDTQHYTIAFEMAEQGSSDKQFAFYIKDGVFYIYNPAIGGIALADFDFDYLMSLVLALPDVAGNLMDTQVANMPIKNLLGLVFQLFTKANVSEYSDSTLYQINLNPKGLNSIINIINIINLDSILSQAGLNLKLSGLINWFKSILPDIDIVMSMKVDKVSGHATDLNCSASTKDTSVFNFTTSKFEIVDNGSLDNIVPDEINEYVPFSLGDLDLTVDLTLDSTDGDLGKLINAFVGKNVFVENALILQAGVKYRLNIKTHLDISQKNEGDNNLIALSIQQVFDDNTTKEYISAYYKQGFIYVNLADTLGGIYSGKGIKVGVELDSLIAQLKEVIRGGIDSVFGTNNGKVDANTMLSAGSVVALSQEDDGYYISDGMHNFLKVLVGVFGIDGEYIKVENGNEGDSKYSILKVQVNNKFINALMYAIGQKNVSLDDFGNVELAIKLKDGLDYINIDANLQGGINADIMLDDFAIGQDPKAEGFDSFEAYIDSKIGDTSKYTYSVKELVLGVLSGTELGTDIKMTIPKGKYNIADILGLAGISGLENNALVWDITADTILDARLDVKLALNNNALQGYVEIILNRDFAVGSQVLAKQGLLAGIYLDKDGQGYINLSGISLFGVALPNLKVNVDTDKLLEDLLAKVDKDLVFDTSNLSNGDSSQSLATINADGSQTPLTTQSLLSAKGSEIILNSSQFSAVITLATIESLLVAFGVQASLPQGLEAELGIDWTDKGIDLDILANIQSNNPDYNSLGVTIGMNINKSDISIADSSIKDITDQHIVEATQNIQEAESNLIKALMGYVGQMSIDLGLKLSVGDSQQLGAYIEQLVSKWLPDVKWDITLDDMAFNIALKLDRNAQRYVIDISSEDSTGNSNSLVYIGAYGDNVIIDINNIGAYALNDTGVVDSINSIVDKAVNDIKGADLNEIINSLINPDKEDSASVENNSDSQADNSQSQPAKALDDETMQKLLMLLSGVMVEDLTINFDFTKQMLAEVLALVNINVDFLSLDGSIAIADGNANIGIQLGDNALTLDAGIALHKTDSEELDYVVATGLLRAYKDGYTASAENKYEHLRNYLAEKLTELGVYEPSMYENDLSELSKLYTDRLDKDSLVYFGSAEEIKAYATKLLEGIELNANFSLDFNAGEYNILQLISKFTDLSAIGLDENAKLTMKFGDPSIDLSLKFKSAIVADEKGKVNTAMFLAIVANKDLTFGITESGQQQEIILSAGQNLIGLYIYDNSLYIDASALRLLGLDMPVFKADNFELGQFIYDSINNAVDSIFAMANQGLSGYAGVALADENNTQEGTEDNTSDDNIVIAIQEGKIQLAVTLGVIGTLLQNFMAGGENNNIVEIIKSLGDVKIDVSLGSYEGADSKEYLFDLIVSGELLSQTNGNPSDMTLKVSADTKDMVVGASDMYASLHDEIGKIVQGYDKTYSDLVQGIAEKLLTGSLEVDLNVELNEGKYLLNDLINSILKVALGNDGISVPISIDTANFSKNLQIAMQWSINPNTQALTFMLEVKSNNIVQIGIYLHKGQLLVDAVGLGLVRINITNIKVIEDMTTALTNAIGSLQGLDLNELLGNLFKPKANDNTQTIATEGEGSQSGNAWIGQLFGALMVENTNIKLKLSSVLLNDVILALTGKDIGFAEDLFDLNVNLGIINGIINFDGYMFGNDESALINMSIDAGLSNDKIVSDAYIPSRFVLDNYEIDATDTSTLLTDILDKIANIEMKARFGLNFNAGTYNIAELLSNFGLTQFAGTQLLWTFSADTYIKLVLDAKIKLNSKDNSLSGQNDSMASIELKADGDVKLGNDVIIKDGSVLFGIYSYEGKVYIDASGISILGFDMPIFAIDYDLIGSLIEKLMNTVAPAQGDIVRVMSADGESTYLQALGASGDVVDGGEDNGESQPADNGNISIGITENEIVIAFTLQAIMSLLKDFGVNINADLSMFDLSPMIRIGDTISLSLTGELIGDVNGGQSDFGVHIDIDKKDLVFGIDTNNLNEYLSQKAQKYNNYNDDVIATLKSVFAKNSVSLDIDFTAQAGAVDIISLISGLIKNTGLNLDFPINLNFDNLNYRMQMLLNWDLDTRSLLFELNLVGDVNSKTLVGLYGSYDDLYLGLEGLGLVNIKAQGSKLVSGIFDMLDNALASINPIILSDILAELLGNKSDITPDVMSGAIAMAEEGSDQGETLAEEKASNDLLKYLISTITIKDSKIYADITSSIMRQIFIALGIDADFMLEAGLEVGLTSDKINGFINIGGYANFDMVLSVLGEADRYLPSDTSNYLILDLTSPNVQGRDIVKQFLDGYDFAFNIDLKSNTVGTGPDSSEPDNQYTRVYIEKINGIRPLDNHSSTVGSNGSSGVLVSLYDIDEREYLSHGSGSKTAMLHFYLDYANNKGTIYLCPGYFVIVIRAVVHINIDLASYMASQSLDLDVLSMLGPIADNLIKSISTMAMPKTADKASLANVQAQADSTQEELTGFAKVFAELDINALLREGITLNVMSTGLTNVNIKFDAYTLNKLIDDVMGCVFGADSAIDMTSIKMNGSQMFSKNYLEYMWWDRLALSNLSTSAAAGGTPYSLWDSIVKQLTPIIGEAVKNLNIQVAGITLTPSTVNTFLDLVLTSQNLHRIVKRVLPIATFNTAELNLNMIDGTVANISFKGVDTGQKIQKYEKDSSGEWQQTSEVLSYTVKSLYPISNNYSAVDGVYSYTYYYNDYNSIYSHKYGGKGIMYRTGFYYNADKNTHGTTSYAFSNEIQVYNMSPSVGDPSLSPGGTIGIVDWGKLATDITFNPYLYSSANSYDWAVNEYWNRYFSGIDKAVYQNGTSIKRGDVVLKYNNATFTKDTLKTLMNKAGTHTIKAQATFYDGTSSYIDITLKVMNVNDGGKDAVRSVEPITLHVYESIPDYVVVNTYDGKQVKYYVDADTISLKGDYQATSPSGGQKTATLAFKNGKEYPVQINYIDSTISAQSVELDWYDLDFSAKDTPEGRQEIIDKLLDNFPMYYDDGTFIPQLLIDNVTWDMTALNDLIDRDSKDLSEASYTVRIKFDKKIGLDGNSVLPVESHLVQNVELTINIKDKTKTSVLLGDQQEQNTLYINPYEYYMYLITGQEEYNPFPSKAQALYASGEKEDLNIILSVLGDDVDYSYAGNSTSMGQEVKALLRQNPDSYAGKGYFDEQYSNINVHINENKIAKIYFDEQKTQDYIIAGQSYSTAYVVFTNGLELQMPVYIKTNGTSALVYIGFDVEIYNNYGKLSAFEGLNGTLLQAFSVEVK